MGAVGERRKASPTARRPNAWGDFRPCLSVGMVTNGRQIGSNIVVVVSSSLRDDVFPGFPPYPVRAFRTPANFEAPGSTHRSWPCANGSSSIAIRRFSHSNTAPPSWSRWPACGSPIEVCVAHYTACGRSRSDAPAGPWDIGYRGHDEVVHGNLARAGRAPRQTGRRHPWTILAQLGLSPGSESGSAAGSRSIVAAPRRR